MKRAMVVGAVLSTLSVNTTLVANPLWTETPLVEPLSDSAPLALSTLSDLAEAFYPSVVTVRVKGELHRHNPSDTPHAQQSQATGLVISDSGYILTNNHVVAKAKEIDIVFVDQSESPAVVVGRDPETDIALLKIKPDGKKLVAAPLGNSDDVRIGEWVIAIGNPFGLNHTVTAGIVSATGRTQVRPSKEQTYSDFIQTDASINLGNSGGPLINTRGVVIGMNTAINRRGQGIGFAIPSNMIKILLPQLAQGKIVRSWLGIDVEDVTEKEAQAMGFSSTYGAKVTQVRQGSPADRADIAVGDILVDFNGKRITNRDELRWMASTAGPGKTASIGVQRNEKQTTKLVVLEEMPTDSHGGGARGGAEPVDASEFSAVGFRAGESVNGVIVVSVHKGSPASVAGLKTGDLIKKVGQSDVDSIQTLAAILGAIPASASLEITVDRDQKSTFLVIKGRQAKP
ncbi:MAG: trypsin-like peptidase domain-containing protein [Myxococcales bacterium]|nr:trypsin-like peptidase domain-containing protein [Myxococcales bacterium]